MCAVLSCSVASNSLRPMDCSPPGFSVHGDSSGKNTGVGCRALFQGIFPTQRSKPKSPTMQVDSYCLSHQGNPGNPYFISYFSTECHEERTVSPSTQMGLQKSNAFPRSGTRRWHTCAGREREVLKDWNASMEEVRRLEQ